MKPLTKILTKIVVAAALSAVMCSTISNVSAQQSIATWWVNLQTNLPPPNPFTNNTANANVIVYPMMKGSGIGEPSGTAEYGGNNWTNAGVADSEANSIANGLYITYAIQAAPGYTVSFSTNVLYFHNSATGPINGELQYSTDGINYTDISPMTYSATHTAVTTLLTNNLSTVAALQNVPSTTTNFFRIVNWGATGTAGTWYIYDNPPAAAGTNGFVVLGNVAPVPPAQNLATWWVNGIATNAGGYPPAPFTNNTAAANVMVGFMMKGQGLGTPTGSSYGEYGGNGWTNAVAGVADSENDSITNGYYITYTIQAAPGYAISFFTNVFYYHNSATGPINGELQYSTDGLNYTDISPMTYSATHTAVTALLTNNLSNIQALQNVPSTITNFFRIVNWGATGTAGTWYIYDNPPAGTPVGTNDFVIIGGLNSLNGVIVAAPTNLVVSPSNTTANAGQTVSFSVSQTGSPASNFWYQIVGSTTNLIPWATSSTLTLTNVLGTNSGSFFVILTNIAGSATSSVVALTVLNDPNIQIQPNSAQGLVDGTVQFSVTAVGTSPSYQWYFSDTSGDIIAPVGTFGDASVISGTNSSTLTIANLQSTDLANFVVVVTNIYGAVTSSVASILSDVNHPGMLPLTRGMLAFWDFDGSQFTNTAANPNCLNNPVPLIGNGTASPVGSTLLPGTSPFSGSTDANDVAGVFTPYGFPQLSPNFSWGTDNYPLTGSNKLNGVQFNVSTVGAKNITVDYDSRVSATASDYERLQYTTNGTTWIDYPSSSTFAGVSSSYEPYSYNLTGFPGVANNPSFGIRIVTEFQSTATYGVSANANYLGTANTYGTAGTVTYDLVAIRGDAITNNNAPPTVGGFINTNTPDYIPLTLQFTAGDDTTPPDQLVYSAVSLNTATVNPTFEFGGTGANRTLTITPNTVPDPSDAAPILITITDGNGDSTAAWFLLTVGSVNLPPTNSLTALVATNTLANTSITIPFKVGDDRTPDSGLTYSVASDNNTVIPVGNIVVGGDTSGGNPTLTITPATNQLGNALISVTVSDNDAQEPRSTTANMAVIVRPNTNVVAIDYFNYDSSGALDTIAAGYWQHLSGIVKQMQAGSGVVTVNTLGNTENLQAQLLGSPYKTNSGTVLYSSFTVNMSPSGMPIVNGSYFTAFNDGSGNTANVEDCLVAATNGAAPGYYRLGIANAVGATASNAQMFAEDLLPGSNYVVVTSLVLSNGFSTLWINPTNQASPSVTDTTAAPGATNNISNIELRESGVNAGVVSVGNLMVGLAFNSVIYPPVANPDSYAVTENSTNLLNPLLNDVGGSLSLVSVNPTNGTAIINGGTNITFIPTNKFVGTATIAYTIMDNIGETNNSTITVTVTNIPPLANPDSYSVVENSANDLFSPLTNDVVETSGGTLSLVSVSETDGNGTPTISGNQVRFTPRSGFVGTATIGYMVTDGIGGTNSSSITVNVVNLTPIPVNAQVLSKTNLVLTWANAAFSLQSSTNVAGPYVTIPGATSPYTNLIGTNAAGFFRLVH